MTQAVIGEPIITRFVNIDAMFADTFIEQIFRVSPGQLSKLDFFSGAKEPQALGSLTGLCLRLEYGGEADVLPLHDLHEKLLNSGVLTVRIGGKVLAMILLSLLGSLRSPYVLPVALLLSEPITFTVDWKEPVVLARETFIGLGLFGGEKKGGFDG